MTLDPTFSDTVFFSPAALTSAGTTASLDAAENDLIAATNFIVQVTVSSIGTNVVVRFEGSLDGTNFFNLDSLGDTTITANGTTGYNIQNAPLKSIRGRLVSISGGSPSVKFVISAR